MVAVVSTVRVLPLTPIAYSLPHHAAFVLVTCLHAMPYTASLYGHELRLSAAHTMGHPKHAALEPASGYVQ